MANKEIEELKREVQSLKAELATLRREREPTPPPTQQKWRTLPGQGNREFDENGNERVQTGENFPGQPSAPQTAGGGGCWGYKVAPDGRTWTDGTSIQRNTAGEIVTPARTGPDAVGAGQGTGVPGPRKSDLAIIDGLAPLAPPRRPQRDSDED
jgi:hypothetical protein